ncbi:proteasome ATPase [Nitrospirales bacterium NOB]|nr:MAG: proteasome-associated ATPase [Nitrospira sp. OLB3]MBV6470298.1 Proteasome-associated ATPase [Nitrospirota bacterium]MCK6493324.1 proteasome ATPase [Nitrospira sp.]MDL1888134.1 proteasome ATPase [Nitrospirales bacterium NOB]MEB2337334.1 proteasome ATPase [Nitrospirales bacterium]
MAESKGSSGRLRSLRDSVKRLTKSLSDGDGVVTHKNDEHTREVEKLRIQIQSMEEEIRRLYQSRYQLEQATKQNEKLVATLQEAKSQIEALRAEVEKLTAPPSTYGIFSSLNIDGTGNVYVSGRKMKVSLHPSIKAKELRKGQEVILNEALNVIEARGFDVQGEVVRLKDVLEGNRALVTLHFDEEKVAELAEPLLKERLSVGDHLLYDQRSGCVVEKLPKSEAEELVLEEVPDVDYEHIGGLQKEIEQVRDAVELPFLYPHVFSNYKLSAPKGVLLYGPPGCGKTLIAKAVASSIAKKLGHLKDRQVRSYFLHVKGPELLSKYVGESERQVREVFKKAKERADDGHPVIVFFDEMDALFRTRGTGISSDIESTIVPQFLSEIDGVERLNNVIVIGASNRQDLIDPAVLRAGRLDVKVKVGRPDAAAARDIFSKYVTTDLPFAVADLNRHGGDATALVESLMNTTVDAMYATSDENKFIEVTYQNGEKEVLYFKDFASGALIEGIVSRAKKYAVKRAIAQEGDGLRAEDLVRAIREEFKEHEDLPNTTNPDDWAKVAGKKGEKIVHLRTISGGPAESRQIETVSTGHYL